VFAYVGLPHNLKDLKDRGTHTKGYVAYLVMQNRNLEYGEPRCGFNTKHQSTRAPKVDDHENQLDDHDRDPSH